MRFGLRTDDHLRKDARTLKLGDYIAPSFAAPASCNLTESTGLDADALGNLELGCCGLAAPAHFVRWEDRLCGRPETVRTVHVVDEYQNFGYVPGDDSTDNGRYALDVMKRWRKVGLFGRDPIAAFARVDFLNRKQLTDAIFLLGGVFLCLSLPKQTRYGSIFDSRIWDVATDDGGRAGNHMVWLYGDEANSWGYAELVTEAFIERYAYDAYAVASADAVKPDGRAFSGLDLAGLQQAIAAITG
jgi:hypothetical protein